jgi:hypothetical protein
MGIRPDLVVEIRKGILDESDGPLLIHGLKEWHNKKLIVIPHSPRLKPRADFLEERFEMFRKASWRSWSRIIDSIEYYTQRFENLHVDHEKGRPRPHKAVMLPSVMAMTEQGWITDGTIRYSPDLLEIFSRVFEVVRAGNDQSTQFNPFFYLRSEAPLELQITGEVVLRARELEIFRKSLRTSWNADEHAEQQPPSTKTPAYPKNLPEKLKKIRVDVAAVEADWSMAWLPLV